MSDDTFIGRTTRLRTLGGGAVCRWAALGVVLALIGLLRSQFEPILVVGESMAPTYHGGDLLWVHRAAYRTQTPQRGDVVVARYQGDLLVKRVVGLPGEWVEVRRGTLYLNERPSLEPYLVQGGVLSLGRGRLLQNRFALLGDNRTLSASQTVHAVVSPGDVVGRVVAAWRWPWNRPDESEDPFALAAR